MCLLCVPVVLPLPARHDYHGVYGVLVAQSTYKYNTYSKYPMYSVLLYCAYNTCPPPQSPGGGERERKARRMVILGERALWWVIPQWASSPSVAGAYIQYSVLGGLLAIALVKKLLLSADAWCLHTVVSDAFLAVGFVFRELFHWWAVLYIKCWFYVNVRKVPWLRGDHGCGDSHQSRCFSHARTTQTFTHAHTHTPHPPTHHALFIQYNLDDATRSMSPYGIDVQAGGWEVARSRRRARARTVPTRPCDTTTLCELQLYVERFATYCMCSSQAGILGSSSGVYSA